MDAVVDVELVDVDVDLVALVLDGFEVGDHVLGEEVVDASVGELGLKAAGEAAEGFGAGDGLLVDGGEGVLEAVDGEADGVGELGVEEEELEDALRREVRRVDLAVSLKGGGGAEEAEPFEVLVAFRGAVGVGGIGPEVVGR